MAEVIALINELVARTIRVIMLKQNLNISRHDRNSKMVITLFSLSAELERDLVNLRTKEALAAKKDARSNARQAERDHSGQPV